MRERGFTLVEVVVSMLLTAVMVSAVFSIALSSQAGGAKADRRLLAAQASRALSASLKQYVTGDPTTTTILGPSYFWCGGGADSWKMNCPGIQLDSLGNVYALDPYPTMGLVRTHELTCVAAPGSDAACFLPAALRALSGRIWYTVDTTAVNQPPKITISVDWTEPTP